MGIDLNKKADSETIEFGNFSIREYVASIRQEDPERCWPFESSGDYKDFSSQDKVAPASQLSESMSLFSQSVPEHREDTDDVPKATVTPDLSEVEISKGKRAVSETPTAFGVELSKGNKAGSETLTAFELEVSKGNKVGSESLTALELESCKRIKIGFETATAFGLESSKGKGTGSKSEYEYESETETETETATAFELEISKGNKPGSETATAFEIEFFQGNEPGSETATPMELEISKGNKAGSETATPMELEISKANEAGSETATAFELEISKGKEPGSETGNSVAADAADSGTNLKLRKKPKFLLLSDILRDLAGPNVVSYAHFDAGKSDNFNSKFTIDVEDDSDGVTLGSFLRKRKGVEVTPGSSCALNKKQQKTMMEHEKLPADTHNKVAADKLAEALGSVQLEVASMKRNSSVIPTKGTCVRLGWPMPPASGSMVCQPLVEAGGSGRNPRKGPGMALAMPWTGPILVCALNRNPADFSTPGPGNRFMRSPGGY